MIVEILIIEGLKLDMKNLFLEFKAPKLKPINAENGIQRERIFN